MPFDSSTVPYGAVHWTDEANPLGPPANPAAATPLDNANIASAIQAAATYARALVDAHDAYLQALGLGGPIVVTGPRPTVAPGGGAGTTGHGTSASISGTDGAGILQITPGTDATGAGSLASVTFAAPLAAGAGFPRVYVFPASADAAAQDVFVVSTTTDWALQLESIPAEGLAQLDLRWNYLVVWTP